MARQKTLEFDPIDEARRQWAVHGWEDAVPGMAAVTSIMRANQIYLARVDVVLRPFGLSFARYEMLTLLHFSRTGSLPLGKLGARLQVHPASVTNAANRLEAQGLIRREPHQTDRRTTLAKILPKGRRIVRKATDALNASVFASPGLSQPEADALFTLVRSIRVTEGDFEANGSRG